MNICHLITRLIIGGAQENTVLTCRGLVERGHRVTLIAGPETGPEGSLWDSARQSGATLVTANHLRRALSPWHDGLALCELTRILKRIAPDIVHTHSSKAGILGRMAARNAGVPVIIHTIHGMSFNRTQRAFTQWAYRAMERRVARYTTKFVTVADAMIEQSVAAGIAPRDRFVTIRSGMETEHFTPDPTARDRVRQAWGVKPDQIVIGTIARLFRNKGYEEIIAAMPEIAGQVPNVRFVWVGDGKDQPSYERRVQNLGLRGCVHFTGLIPPNDMGGVINGFDILLHASRWEGLPRAIVQSLLCEKPVVAIDLDGAAEVAQPNVTALLASYGDTSGLAQSVVFLCNDPQSRAQFGMAGRGFCLAMFDWRLMAQNISRLYESLVKLG